MISYFSCQIKVGVVDQIDDGCGISNSSVGDTHFIVIIESVGHSSCQSTWISLITGWTNVLHADRVASCRLHSPISLETLMIIQY